MLPAPLLQTYCTRAQGVHRYKGSPSTARNLQFLIARSVLAPKNIWSAKPSIWSCCGCYCNNCFGGAFLRSLWTRIWDFTSLICQHSSSQRALHCKTCTRELFWFAVFAKSLGNSMAQWHEPTPQSKPTLIKKCPPNPGNLSWKGETLADKTRQRLHINSRSHDKKTNNNILNILVEFQFYMPKKDQHCNLLTWSNIFNTNPGHKLSCWYIVQEQHLSGLAASLATISKTNIGQKIIVWAQPVFHVVCMSVLPVPKQPNHHHVIHRGSQRSSYSKQRCLIKRYFNNFFS